MKIPRVIALQLYASLRAVKVLLVPALHLDCARSQREVGIDFTRRIIPGTAQARARPGFDNRPKLCYVPCQNGDAIDAYCLHVGGAFCKRGPTACVSVPCFQPAYWSSLQTRKLPE